MNQDKRRTLADGMEAFLAGEYGAHVVAELNTLIDGERSRLENAQSWEEFQYTKARAEGLKRARQILLLETNVE